MICCAAVLHPSHCLFLQVVNTRNSLPVLQACIKLTVHLTNVGIKRPQRYKSAKSYDLCLFHSPGLRSSRKWRPSQFNTIVSFDGSIIGEYTFLAWKLCAINKACPCTVLMKFICSFAGSSFTTLLRHPSTAAAHSSSVFFGRQCTGTYSIISLSSNKSASTCRISVKQTQNTH